MSPQVQSQDVSHQAEAQVRIGRSAGLMEMLAVLVGPPTGEPLRWDESTAVVRPGLNMQVEAGDLQARAAAHKQGAFMILVMGQFNAGKSTFLNALLGRGILPVGPVPTTAVIQVVQYGVNERVQIFASSGELKEEIDWETFSTRYSLNNADHRTFGADAKKRSQYIDDRFGDIGYALVERDHPLLMNFIRMGDSPGLGESQIRTLKTQSFLPKASAVILVLNAMTPLHEDETKAIERLTADGFTNVFYVINKLNVQEYSDPENVHQVTAGYRDFFENHFVDREGKFDEDLFSRRVFYVDAKLALQGADRGNADDATLSGIVRFRRELERFVASPDRVTGALRRDFEASMSAIRRATQEVGVGRQTLEAPLEALIERKEASDAALNALEKGEAPAVSVSIPVVRDQIEITGERIADILYIDLLDRVNNWRDAWDPSDERLSELRSLVNVRSALALKREEMQGRDQDESDETTLHNRIGAEVQKYLQSLLVEWEEGVPELLTAQLAEPARKRQELIDQFVKELATAKGRFIGGEVPVEQLALPSDLALGLGGLSSLGSASGFQSHSVSMLLAKQIGSAIGIYLIGIFLPVSWPFLIARLGLQVWNLDRNASRFADQNMAALGKTIFDNFEEKIREQRAEIRTTARSAFREQAAITCDALQGRIDEVRGQIDATLAALENDEATRAELERLGSIEAVLALLAEEISVTTRERGLTDDERQKYLQTEERAHADRDSGAPAPGA